MYTRKMPSYLATPHVYGAEVKLKFADCLCIVIPPSGTSLKAWARAALHESKQPTHTPFRSVEVRTASVNDEPIFLHAGDFILESAIVTKTRPIDFPITQWLDTLTAFIRAALKECMRNPKIYGGTLTPIEIVRRMMHREWGSTSDAFYKVLEKGGVMPPVLDELVHQTFAEFLRLPEPKVFKYILNEEVMNFVISLVQKRQTLPRSLRV